MRKLLTILALALMTTPLAAQIGSVPFTFSPGTTISSSQVNTNFSTVYSNALNRTGGTMTGTLTTLAILPTSDNASDIGSAALSYNDAWFDGSVTIATLTGSVAGITTLTSTTHISAQSAMGTAASISSGAIVSISGTFTGSGAGFGISVNPSITVPASGIGALLSNLGTLIEAGSGTHALMAAQRIMIPTITAGAATVTNTASLYVEGQPVATVSGDNYAVWVDSGKVMSDEGYYERARTFAMGMAQTRSFSAGNFTQDSGTWTVESGDVTTDSYRVIGDTLIWHVRLVTTTIASTPSQLRITIPGGFTAAETVANVCLVGAATAVTTSCATAASSTTMTITNLNGGAFTNGTNDTAVSLTISFKIS